MKSLIEPVVGILDQNSYQLYKAPSYVPEGVVMFTCWHDMARMLNQDTMDMIRFNILGKRFCRYSASREDAAINLWVTMTRDARLLPGINIYKYSGRVKDKLGNIKYTLWGPHELMQIAWRPGVERPHVINVGIRNMPTMARRLYQLLLDDGREVMTHRQIIQVINAGWDTLESVRGPRELLTAYCRNVYYPLQMIRRITYLDFCKSKTLRDIDLDIAAIEPQELTLVPEG